MNMGMGMGMGIQPGQMGGLPQQGRGMIPGMGQPGMMPTTAPGAVPASVEALSAAPANQQKQLLGEALYPKIQVLQPDLAGKITGMLLEMDNSELLGL